LYDSSKIVFYRSSQAFLAADRLKPGIRFFPFFVMSVTQTLVWLLQSFLTEVVLWFCGFYPFPILPQDAEQ
jgi:hypothetical protein